VKVYVVGAGAVGTFLGEALRTTGAGVTYAPRKLEEVVPVEADLAVVAVKAYATQGAVETLRRALPEGSDAAIFTPQNGVGNEEILAQAFGEDRVVSGALTTAVERLPDGTVAAANAGGLAFAPVGRKAHNYLIAAFERTPVQVRVCADYRAMKWSKMALNIVCNASCAILDVLPAEIVAHPRLFALELAAVRELRAVMRSLNLRPLDLPRYPVRAFFRAAALPGPLAYGLLGRRIAGARGSKPPSLLLDVREGRGRTEACALNGAIAESGIRMSVPVPVNAAFARLADAVAADPDARARYRRSPETLTAEVEKS
jgi:2-dehydropantoate 2-reductase